MYILILLMTYVSAIYEYNLSARPDYDRDIMRKKAMAVFNKFNHHHSFVKKAITSVTFADRADGSFVDPTFPQPGTVLGASKERCQNSTANGAYCKSNDLDKYTLFFEDGEGYEIPVFLISTENESMEDSNEEFDDENGSWYYFSIMQLNNSLYYDDEAASKVVCFEEGKALQDEGVSMCSNQADKHIDAGGNLVGSCCKDGRRVIVSYKSIDPRWLNRVTNGVNMDFWRAMMDVTYSSNLGIIQWNNSKNKWIFRGKTSIYASYYKVLQAWNEQENQKAAEDSSYIPKGMPRYMTRTTTWELPEIFTQDFFKNLNGQDLCRRHGCLFRINEM